MNEWVGKMLGKVRIDSLLARGGMAEVYLGTHTTLQREVAIKILRNQYEDDPDLLERFQREARVVAKLRHQNIVQVFDYDAIDDHPYIVMEFVSGPSLSKYLGALHKAKGQLEVSEINKIIVGVASALQYAHDSGVIHRDIKPGNIILTSHTKPVVPGEPLPEDFEPVLTDFGLVRFLNSSRQTSAGQTAGTPAYMSPEQARGETTDGRTDIYSLGIVLYEMLAGKVPFDGETTMSILLKHITDPPPPVPGLSPQLQKVLDKSLAKDKEQRFQKPIELARAINAVAISETKQSTFMGLMTVAEPPSIQMAEPVDSVIVVSTPQKPPRRWLPVAVGSVALALFGVVYFSGNLVPASPAATSTVMASASPTIRSLVALSDLSDIGSKIVLHFRDGEATMDQAFLEARAVPAAPEGTQYEAWLIGPSGSISLGILVLDSNGNGTLTYNASQKENLLSLYDQAALTLTSKAGATPSAENMPAYTYTLPSDGLAYLRVILVADSDTPAQAPLITILNAQTQLLEQSAKDLSNAFAAGDQTSTRKHAETILNILVGKQSADHKDWNGDGKVSDPSDGYGLLLNGTSAGSIGAIFTQTGYVIDAPRASQNMILHGGEVKVCAQNVSGLLPALRTQVKNVLAAKSLAEMEQPVKDIAELSDQIINGADVNGTGKVEALTGECGLTTIYDSALAMADMPLLPVNAGTATAVASGTPSGPYVTRTPTRSGSGGNAAPTQKGNNAGGNGNGGNGGGHGNGGGNGGKP